MFVVKSRVIGLLVLAGLIVLNPMSDPPGRHARAELPADSFVRAVVTRNPLLFGLCLAERVDVNAADREGRTPLLVATLQGDAAMIERLLEIGANVDIADRTGRTPLMIAAGQGDLGRLTGFVARSSRPEGTDSDGRSAAHYALSAGHYECLELLLPLMPEADTPAADGRDLLALACDKGDRRMITAILRRLPNDLEWRSCTRDALQAALAFEDSDLLRLLLEKHPAPPTVSGRAIPLLAQAILEDDTKTARALLAGGADANTILPMPVEKEFVSRLPTEFMRGYVRGDKDVTLLMLAAGLGRTEQVRALLDAGADRNRATTRYRMLPLYFAARTKEVQCVQLLLGRGPAREQLRVEISLATQRASVIKDGVAVLNTSVSTGRKGFDTPAGEYVITDKKRSHRSSLYHVAMPYFMRLNCLDFGLHAGNVPNYPASHGCIRLPADVAEKIFAEVPIGTMVTIN